MKHSIHSDLNNRCTRLVPLVLVACCWVSLLLNCAQLAARDDISDEIQKSQEMAIEKYPELKVANSAFNTTFLTAVKLLKEKKPEFFTDPEWPLKLSDSVAVDLKITPKYALDAPPIQQSQEDAHASEALERYCAQAVKLALKKHEIIGSVKDWFETEDHLDSERIADSLQIAALQSEERFPEIVETFLENVLLSGAPRAMPRNKEWIDGVLLTRSSWRCIEKYSNAEQCQIIGRLLAKCGNSKLVTKWIGTAYSGNNLREKSLLSNDERVTYRPPGYHLRSAIAEVILNSNYHLESLPIDKVDFLTAASGAKIWKIYQRTSPSEWGMVGGWSILDKLPPEAPSYNKLEWLKTLEHFENAIESRARVLGRLTNVEEPPPPDFWGCFEAYLVCGFCEFNDTQEGLEWIDSVCKQTALSPDPVTRSASRLAGAFKISALRWASKLK